MSSSCILKKHTPWLVDVEYMIPFLPPRALYVTQDRSWDSTEKITVVVTKQRGAEAHVVKKNGLGEKLPLEKIKLTRGRFSKSVPIFLLPGFGIITPKTPDGYFSAAQHKLKVAAEQIAEQRDAFIAAAIDSLKKYAAEFVDYNGVVDIQDKTVKYRIDTSLVGAGAGECVLLRVTSEYGSETPQVYFGEDDHPEVYIALETPLDPHDPVFVKIA